MLVKNTQNTFFHFIILLFCCFCFSFLSAQAEMPVVNKHSVFGEKLQYGGGFGINISSGYTDVFVAPSIIYNFNTRIAVGTGLNLNYISLVDNYSSLIYGVNMLLLVNPIPEIQLSVDFNPSRVNYEQKNNSFNTENYWQKRLILGVGYRTGNVTIGMGYNVLRNPLYDTDPFVPFVRAYF
jgi:hypothetical protein